MYNASNNHFLNLKLGQTVLNNTRKKTILKFFYSNNQQEKSSFICIFVFTSKKILTLSNKTPYYHYNSNFIHPAYCSCKIYCKLSEKTPTFREVKTDLTIESIFIFCNTKQNEYYSIPQQYFRSHIPYLGFIFSVTYLG